MHYDDVLSGANDVDVRQSSSDGQIGLFAGLIISCRLRVGSFQHLSARYNTHLHTSAYVTDRHFSPALTLRLYTGFPLKCHNKKS